MVDEAGRRRADAALLGQMTGPLPGIDQPGYRTAVGTHQQLAGAQGLEVPPHGRAGHAERAGEVVDVDGPALGDAIQDHAEPLLLPHAWDAIRHVIDYAHLIDC